MNPTKRAIGCYLGIVVAGFAIAAWALNGATPNGTSGVSTLLLVAAILEFAAVILTFAAGPRPIFNVISIITTVLIAYALTTSFASQMNQLGSVVSGLDDVSTLSQFFTFVAVAGIALVLSLVDNFLGKAKSA